MADIVEAAKIAAIRAVEASKPAGIYFGTVTGIEPLKINVEQKITLEEKQLVLTHNVAVNNGLVDGDVVILLRVQGGQKYVVLDKTV